MTPCFEFSKHICGELSWLPATLRTSSEWDSRDVRYYENDNTVVIRSMGLFCNHKCLPQGVFAPQQTAWFEKKLFDEKSDVIARQVVSVINI